MSTQPTQDIFELVLARPAAETDAPQGTIRGLPGRAGLIHLWWRSAQQGHRLVQVYVDGRLNTVTVDPEQRELWLMCDPTEPHLIELLAVSADDAEFIWRPQPALLGAVPSTRPRATLTLLRDECLPPDTVITVMVDGQEVFRGPLWPAGEHRGGFGSLFGLGEFGRDALTGPGLGTAQSQLGMGALGADGTVWTWTSSKLSAGPHTIAAQAVDSSGRVITELPEPITLTIAAPPTVAGTFCVDPDFRLSWSE